MSTPANQLGLPPPTLDPSQYPAYLDAQRKQQLAQMLMGSLQSANQTPSSWDSMRVVPKRGFLQNASVLADALLAGKASKSANQATSSYIQGLYGGGGQQQPSSAAAPAAASGDDGHPFNGPFGGISVPGQTPPASGLVQPAATAPQAPARNPLIPPGMTPGSAQAMLNLMGPTEYAKNFLSQTPEWQNALRANNGDVNAAMAQMHAAGVKQGAIDMRAGGSVAIPDPSAPGGYRMIRAPNLGPGQEATYDASGNVTGVRNIPGAVAAGAATKGAETAATVENTPRDVPIGGGRTALMYPGQVPGLGAPPASAAAPAGAAPSAAAQPAPPASPGPPGAPAASPAPKGPAPTLPLKAQLPQQGLWSSVPQLNIPSTPGQASDEYTMARLKDAAAKHSELVNTYGQEAKLADQQINYNNEALKALPSASVGPMSEWLTNNRSRLLEMGVPANLIPASGTVTSSLELNKYLLNSALQGARTIYGNRMTQNEVKLQTEDMSPSSHMTADAIKSLIDQNNVQAQYTKQRAQDYNTYVNQYHGDPQQFEQWYAAKRPLTRFVSQQQTPSAAVQRLQQNPSLLPDFKAKYGWDPTQ
jgi:hypothetical protein